MPPFSSVSDIWSAGAAIPYRSIDRGYCTHRRTVVNRSASIWLG